MTRNRKVLLKHTIVIPTFNEEAEIRACLQRLQGLRAQGFEVIVVDGGSVDSTARLTENLCDHFILSCRSRAQQMNAGAKLAKGDFIFFLHVDSQLPDNFSELIVTMTTTFLQQNKFCWGRFDVKLSGKHWAFRMIETMMNGRSRLTGIATGDQVIFMSQALYKAANGFPEIALMEDIAMSRRLKAVCAPLCLRQKVMTSSRRWEQNGIINTVIKMWLLRLSYFLGTDPTKLAKQYE